jgi:hypothetical protein
VVDSGLLIGLGALIALLFVAGLVASARAGPGRARPGSPIEARERAIATQIDVEEHDIGEMIEARDERRRRRGRPSIGDELAERAREPGDER